MKHFCKIIAEVRTGNFEFKRAYLKELACRWIGGKKSLSIRLCCAFFFFIVSCPFVINLFLIFSVQAKL